jgi:hypothetical protein
MSRIYCKNKRYNGISAGIAFVKGVGVSNDSRLLSWFIENGYIIMKDLDEMNYKELVEYAREQGINGIGTKKNELLKTLKEMEAKPDD